MLCRAGIPPRLRRPGNLPDRFPAPVTKVTCAAPYREAREAAATILDHLNDPVDKVRSAAARFLLDLDVREAAPIFVERLNEEDDPDIAELLVRGVAAWKRADALPALRQIAASDWVEAEEERGEAVKEAIRTLTTRNP